MEAKRKGGREKGKGREPEKWLASVYQLSAISYQLAHQPPHQLRAALLEHDAKRRVERLSWCK
jgi:hypothetical protein